MLYVVNEYLGFVVWWLFTLRGSSETGKTLWKKLWEKQIFTATIHKHDFWKSLRIISSGKNGKNPGAELSCQRAIESVQRMGPWSWRCFGSLGLSEAFTGPEVPGNHCVSPLVGRCLAHLPSQRISICLGSGQLVTAWEGTFFSSSGRFDLRQLWECTFFLSVLLQGCKSDEWN